jgi:hypothetical protein
MRGLFNLILNVDFDFAQPTVINGKIKADFLYFEFAR